MSSAILEDWQDLLGQPTHMMGILGEAKNQKSFSPGSVLFGPLFSRYHLAYTVGIRRITGRYHSCLGHQDSVLLDIYPASINLSTS